MSKNLNRGLLKTIQDFLTSYDGKMVLNFAYSWGAAIVILGALFKLTHLPGANLMLYIGMGTEVLVFFISAFDRPAKNYRWESIFPNLEITGKGPKKDEEEDYESENGSLLPEGTETTPGLPAAGTIPGGVVYVGSGSHSAGSGGADAALQTAAQVAGDSLPGGSTTVIGGGFAGETPATILPMEELEEATQAYLEKLKEMTETIGRLNEKMESFSCDPEQMEGVNRHIAGLNAIFELQLRSASKQVESVDKVHEQTEKMAAQIEELNRVYERMLHAMTANVINQQSVTPNK